MKYRSTNVKKMASKPLTVVSREEDICMLVRVDKKTTSTLAVLSSLDGINFSVIDKKVSIKNLSNKAERIKNCDRFSISRTPNGYVMTYVRVSGVKKNEKVLVVARSKDIYNWTLKSELPVDESHHTTTVYNKPKDRFELYRDGLFIKHESSITLSLWRERSTLLFTSRNGQFDSDKLSIIGSMVTKDGIIVFYDASIEHDKKTLLQAGAVITDINDPKRIIWRSNEPIWQGVVESPQKSLPISPLGLVSFREKFFIYWMTADFNLIVATIPAVFKEAEDSRYHPKILNRFKGNPIIESRQDFVWEGEGTFNPTVVQDDEGVIHLLYRAIGRDGLSRVGYARSKDGMHFTKRSSFPVFEPKMGFGMPDPKAVKGPIGYHPAMYTSGGGWGGSEDPRAVKIDDRIYMMYVAFEGWNSVRIALTSISVEDFKAGKWNWKKPVHLSPPGKINKNWLLFPEKINGKYAIIHSITPKILIEYIDDLDNFDDYIESPRKEGPQPGRRNKWDGLLRGAGPPPVKTDLGWLLLYHALDKNDLNKYKIGAMILDKDNPEKVLYRSSHPILSPDMHYENNGKPGVIYASGATIKGDDLHVYYGGADKVVCVATTPLKKFLDYLVTGSTKTYQLKKV